MWVLLLLASVPGLAVPFVPQTEDTCGAAALAMVLQYHGRAVPHDAIAAALVEPELHGIRGSRLADFARGRGMTAIAFSGDLALLREHLDKGRPLVLAIASGKDRFHDVVAVGFDSERREVTVHDPAVGPSRRMSERELERRWAASGRWTLLVQPAAEGPESLPAQERPAETPPASGTADGGPADAYQALVARAVAEARAGAADTAKRLLDSAAASEPARREAWTERGGLLFLEGDYARAARDLRRALAIGEDAYVRDLLASSLHLAGRELEALAVWNPLGRPTLAAVEIGGLRHTRDAVARREIGVGSGETLTPSAVRAARRRLDETGAFERVTLRPRPLGDGTADLEVALSERHGFAAGPVDFLVSTGVDLAWQRVRLRYANAGGMGITLAGSLRWQENRPEAVLQIAWPRPFGLPLYARLAGVRGEQAYEIDDAFTLRQRGLELGLRHVHGAGTVFVAGARWRQRTFVPGEQAEASGGQPLGRSVVAIDLGVESRLLETGRHRVDASFGLRGAGHLIGSSVDFARLDGQLRYEGVLSRREGRAVERSVLVARLRGGWGSRETPIDEMYALGISPDSDLPLRAHPLTARGVIGRNPIGRSVLLLNAEWRQRVLHRPMFDVGVVAFADAGRVGRPMGALRDVEGLVDIGLGLRIIVLTRATLRVDYAWGLTDRHRALFVGLNQAF